MNAKLLWPAFCLGLLVSVTAVASPPGRCLLVRKPTEPDHVAGSEIEHNRQVIDTERRKGEESRDDSEKLAAAAAQLTAFKNIFSAYPHPLSGQRILLYPWGIETPHPSDYGEPSPEKRLGMLFEISRQVLSPALKANHQGAVDWAQEVLQALRDRPEQQSAKDKKRSSATEAADWMFPSGSLAPLGPVLAVEVAGAANAGDLKVSIDDGQPCDGLREIPTGSHGITWAYGEQRGEGCFRRSDGDDQTIVIRVSSGEVLSSEGLPFICARPSRVEQLAPITLPPGAPPPPPPPPPQGKSELDSLGVVSGGIGLAALGSGIWLFADSRSDALALKEKAGRLCPRKACPDKASWSVVVDAREQVKWMWTGIALGLAGAGVVSLSAWSVFLPHGSATRTGRGSSAPEVVDVTPFVTADGAGISLRGAY